MVEEAISFWTEIQRYEDMLAADPNSYCFGPLSELYRKLGLLDDAISVAKKGCALHPDYPGAFFALGAACFDEGLKQEARQALERVVLINPENFRAQRLLGQLYVEEGEVALAQKALGEVLLQNPDDVECALLLRSIASLSAAAAPEEEVLEEAEVIEDLTEVFEESVESDLVPELELALESEPVPEPESLRFDLEPASESELGFDLEPALEPALVPEPGEPEEEDAGWGDLFVEPEGPAKGSVQPPSRDPLTTATLAELYVSQGFLDKAMVIYQELMAADPAQQSYRLRCGELAALRQRQREAEPPAAASAPIPGPAAEPAPQQVDAEVELSRWLENIRRRRDGV